MKFNLIITGYGGQGVLTLAEIVSKAAFKQGYEVKEAELHGLAQRGGSLDCHVRFGERIYSPLVARARADLVIALEALEAWRACYWANPDTAFLVNKKLFNVNLSMEKVLAEIKKFTRYLYLVDADKEIEKLSRDTAMANIFMLGRALKLKLLPLKQELVWQAIKERIRPIFLEENKRVFEAGLK